MTFVRIFSALLFAAMPCWAADAGAVAATAPTHLSGPYLTPPILPPGGLMTVDSAELVPPVSKTDPSLAPVTATGPVPSADPSPATKNVTINLIQLMVKRGLIGKDDATALVKQAQQEADQAQGRGGAPVAASNTGHDAQGMLRSPPSAPTGGGGGDDAVAVTYVPDVVRNQIRDEVTADVMAQARQAGLATKNDIPDWVHRFRITGDVRARYEGDFYPDGNATGAFVNFNAINTGAPFNINGSPLIPPTYNVDQERDRIRLRARIGTEVNLDHGFTAGLRLGTGSDNQPVSENQTLGGVNSFTQNQGGDFSKYQIWLDRAFIRYEWAPTPKSNFSASVGRFDNPFFGTTMIWADDLAFDGLVVKGKYEVADGVTPFVTAGAFPVYNTDLNFGTGSTSAGQGYESEDKWLYAGQVGVNWKINKDLNFKGAFAFYDFEDIQGKVSAPIDQDVFTSVGSGFQGSTDDSRPFFAQHGNTYIALRDVQPGVLPPATSPDYQYYGLATAFREAVVTTQLDYSHFDPFHISLVTEFVDNTAFDRSAIENNGPAVAPGPQNNNNGSTFAGGSFGYNAKITGGKSTLDVLWDWNLSLTYRYLESDAVVDGFNDADFGGPLVGTNLQGFIIGANLALSPHIWAGLRFMSADSIAGPAYHNDLVQFDLNAKF